MKKRIRLIVKMTTILLFIIVTTGCWDRLEIEEQAYIVVVGIDKGEKEKYEITYQIANPQGGGFGNVVGSSPKEPSAEILTFTVPSIIAARDIASATITRRPSFSHTKTLVIGEKFAKSEEFFSVVSAALRDRQIRRDTYVLICKEKASEFIRGNKPMLETRPHKFYEYMSTRWEESGIVPFSNFHRIVHKIVGNEELTLINYGTAKHSKNDILANEDEYTAGNIPKEGGNPVEIIGSAIIKDGKMAGALSGEETRFCLILRPRSKVRQILSTFPDPIKPGYRVDAYVSKYEKNKYDMKLDQEKPKIQAVIPIDVTIASIPSGIDYITDMEKQDKLKRTIEKYLEDKSMKLVEKMKEQYEAEPFEWSYIARKEFSTWEEFKDYGWKDKFIKSEVSIDYKVKIKGIGKQLIPPKVGAE